MISQESALQPPPIDFSLDDISLLELLDIYHPPPSLLPTSLSLEILSSTGNSASAGNVAGNTVLPLMGLDTNAMLQSDISIDFGLSTKTTSSRTSDASLCEIASPHTVSPLALHTNLMLIAQTQNGSPDSPLSPDASILSFNDDTQSIYSLTSQSTSTTAPTSPTQESQIDSIGNMSRKRKSVAPVSKRRVRKMPPYFSEFELRLDDWITVPITETTQEHFVDVAKYLLKYFVKATDVSSPFLKCPTKGQEATKWNMFLRENGFQEISLSHIKERSGIRPKSSPTYKHSYEFLEDMYNMISQAKQFNDTWAQHARKFERRLGKKLYEMACDGDMHNVFVHKNWTFIAKAHSHEE